MNATTEAVSTDKALQLLANQKRRKILRVLIEADDEAVTIDELVTEITDGKSPARISDRTQSQHPATELYHTHLPKLADVGIIDYDERTETVRYQSHAGIESLLQCVSKCLE